MNILSVNISNNKKALLILFISLLTVVTVLTRTVNNEQNMQWFDDSARDITVAALIVENGKYTDIRPGTGFTLPLKNSSLYFNFLAGLYWLSGKNSSVFLDLYSTITGIITVISIFFIGYIIYGFKLAIPASLTVLIHPLVIFINVSVYQRYLLSSITPLFVLLTLIAFRAKKLIYLGIATIIFLLLLASHYASLTFLPVFLGIHYEVLKIKNNKKNIFLYVLFLIISISAFLATVNVNLDNIPIPQLTEAVQFSFMTPMYQMFDFFQAILNWDIKIFTILLVAIVFLLVLKKKKKKIEKVFYWILTSYFLFQIVIVYALGLYNLTHVYFYHYLSIFMLVPYISVIYSTTKEGNQHISDIFLFIVFLSFAAYLLLFPQTKIDSKKDYFRTKLIAQKITEHNLQVNKLENYCPIVVDNTVWASTGWFGSSINHHLIKNIDEYYSLRQNGNNLTYKTEHFDSFYLICRMWTENEESFTYSSDLHTITKRCIDDLFTNHISEIKQNNVNIKTIFNEERESDDRFVVLFIKMNGYSISNDFLLDPWPTTY